MGKKCKPELYEDQDPLDGYKAVGCLFIGMTLIVLLLFIFGLLITWLKT